MSARPFWWPDAKGFVLITYALITVGILLMIRETPSLLTSAPFMTLASGFMGAGGLGLIAAFHYGSSSGSKDSGDRADKAMDLAKTAMDQGTGDGAKK